MIRGLLAWPWSESVFLALTKTEVGSQVFEKRDLNHDLATAHALAIALPTKVSSQLGASWLRF